MKIFFSFILLIGLIFGKTQIAYSSSQIVLNDSQGVVIEHLRLQVPKEYRQAWLFAEKKSWEPWLKTQRGFLGRKLFWDQRNEEATLMIKWSTRQNWKNIPQEEINLVQDQFEKIARAEIGNDNDVINPFPLIFEGELLPQ